jgi:hypothetical protein
MDRMNEEEKRVTAILTRYYWWLYIGLDAVESVVT